MDKQTKERKIKALSEFKYLDIEINSCYGIIEKFEKKVSDDDITAEAQNKYAKCIQKIKTQINKAQTTKKAILNAINEIDIPILKDLLYERYINNLMWFQISMKLNYDEKYLCGNLHTKALEKINI